MQRGEIWAYNAVTTRPQPRLRLIISADAINDASPLLICLQVVEDEDPESRGAPPPGGGGGGGGGPRGSHHVEIALRAALALD
jgi:hypothetical protein